MLFGHNESLKHCDNVREKGIERDRQTDRNPALFAGMRVECMLLLISQPLESVKTPSVAEGRQEEEE